MRSGYSTPNPNPNPNPIPIPNPNPNPTPTPTPHQEWILDAIERAVAKATSLPLDVVLVHYGACPSGPRYKRLKRKATAVDAGAGDGSGGDDSGGEAAGAGAGAAGGKRSERSSPPSPSRAPAPKAATTGERATETAGREREPGPAQADIRQFFGGR